jgi:hypothetical protein
LKGHDESDQVEELSEVEDQVEDIPAQKETPRIDSAIFDDSLNEAQSLQQDIHVENTVVEEVEEQNEEDEDDLDFENLELDDSELDMDSIRALVKTQLNSKHPNRSISKRY